MDATFKAFIVFLIFDFKCVHSTLVMKGRVQMVSYHIHKKVDFGFLVDHKTGHV